MIGDSESEQKAQKQTTIELLRWAIKQVQQSEQAWSRMKQSRETIKDVLSNGWVDVTPIGPLVIDIELSICPKQSKEQAKDARKKERERVARERKIERKLIELKALGWVAPRVSALDYSGEGDV